MLLLFCAAAGSCTHTIRYDVTLDSALLHLVSDEGACTHRKLRGNQPDVKMDSAGNFFWSILSVRLLAVDAGKELRREYSEYR